MGSNLMKLFEQIYENVPLFYERFITDTLGRQFTYSQIIRHDMIGYAYEYKCKTDYRTLRWTYFRNHCRRDCWLHAGRNNVTIYVEVLDDDNAIIPENIKKPP